jgi:hypothetical protein
MILATGIYVAICGLSIYHSDQLHSFRLWNTRSGLYVH